MNPHKFHLFQYLRGNAPILTGILIGAITFCVVLTGKYLGHQGHTLMVGHGSHDTYTAALMAGARNGLEKFSGQDAGPGLRDNAARESTAEDYATVTLHGTEGHQATPASPDETATVSQDLHNQKSPRPASAIRSTAPATTGFDNAATDAGLMDTSGLIWEEIDAGSSTFPTPGHPDSAPAPYMEPADGSSNTDSASLDPAVVMPPADNGITIAPEEQPWATPDCPVELPQGSTAADAEEMQRQYGCRYLHYCRLLNDGSDADFCWYGFYSAPAFNG